jgi:hypothetical protein
LLFSDKRSTKTDDKGATTTLLFSYPTFLFFFLVPAHYHGSKCETKHQLESKQHRKEHHVVNIFMKKNLLLVVVCGQSGKLSKFYPILSLEHLQHFSSAHYLS